MTMSGKITTIAIALCTFGTQADAGYREDVARCEDQATISHSRQSYTPSATSTAVSLLADLAGAALSNRDIGDELGRSAQREVRAAEREVLANERRQEREYERCMRNAERYDRDDGRGR